MNNKPLTRVAKMSTHRLRQSLANQGLLKTIVSMASAVDDKLINSVDRYYRIQTSGVIKLSATAFDRDRIDDATQYAPVSGWGLRRFLRDLALPRYLRFVDLGCGMGRACIVAADYGFARVTGVELAKDLYYKAEENVSSSRLSPECKSTTRILHADALDYVVQSDDDVFFMFRPFSPAFLEQVIDRIVRRSEVQQRQLLLIYSERAGAIGESSTILSRSAFQILEERSIWGQAFHVFQCAPAGE